MYYLGIDIGKRKHVAAMLNDEGRAVIKGFSFDNSIEGGNALLEKITQHLADLDSLVIGMEATGHYWLSLYSFLRESTMHIHVVNPILTDGWRKHTEIRKRKTDKIDALMIAEMIRYGNYVETTLSDENILSLRNLSRFRTFLVQSVSDLKLKTISILDQVFPEYQSVFSDIFGQTSREILKNFQTPQDWEDMETLKIQSVLEQIRFKKFGLEKIDELASLAQHSFGITFCQDSFAFQLKDLVEQISFIDLQVKEVEAKIKDILDKINTPILTIPGIGLVTGASILGEIGDINRFSNPSQLVAFAGLDASVSQSGDYTGTHNRMSKRGSPYLRHALFQSAFVASQNDPVLKAFYLKKKSEGKHHYTAIGAVARKMCNLIFVILKENRPYEIRQIHE
jgi:transposase